MNRQSCVTSPPANARTGIPGLLRLAAVAWVVAGLGGCSTLSYYGQAVRGHWALMDQREPLVDILADAERDATLRAELGWLLAARVFAATELDLPDNDSYSTYAVLDRPYVVWNVVATPALSLEPKTWCFPVAGCVSYRGYFAKADAEAHAARLRATGYDVHIGGAVAYSTLGWFADPIVSPMLERGRIRAAEIIIHELTHQRLYIAGATRFNEGLATAAARVGLERWLQRAAPEGLATYRDRLRRQDRFRTLVESTREALEALYARTDLSEAEKRTRKAEQIAELRARYRWIRDTAWDGYSGYDAWFEEPINNAKLAGVATYHTLVPGFEALLARCSGDFARFFAAAERIGAAATPAARQAALENATNCATGTGETGPEALP